MKVPVAIPRVCASPSGQTGEGPFSVSVQRKETEALPFCCRAKWQAGPCEQRHQCLDQTLVAGHEWSGRQRGRQVKDPAEHKHPFAKGDLVHLHKHPFARGVCPATVSPGSNICVSFGSERRL